MTDRDAKPCPSMADAAEMLWVVLANVSGGDWTKQTPEWQAAAARWRDYYHAALFALTECRAAAEPPQDVKGTGDKSAVAGLIAELQAWDRDAIGDPLSEEMFALKERAAAAIAAMQRQLDALMEHANDCDRKEVMQNDRTDSRRDGADAVTGAAHPNHAEPPQDVAAIIARLNADADAWMFYGGQHIQSCCTTADLEREAAALLAAMQADRAKDAQAMDALIAGARKDADALAAMAKEREEDQARGARLAEWLEQAERALAEAQRIDRSRQND